MHYILKSHGELYPGHPQSVWRPPGGVDQGGLTTPASAQQPFITHFVYIGTDPQPLSTNISHKIGHKMEPITWW